MNTKRKSIDQANVYVLYYLIFQKKSRKTKKTENQLSYPVRGIDYESEILTRESNVPSEWTPYVAPMNNLNLLPMNRTGRP
jgi:hypothetical protein